MFKIVKVKYKLGDGSKYKETFTLKRVDSITDDAIEKLVTRYICEEHYLDKVDPYKCGGYIGNDYLEYLTIQISKEL